MCACVDEPPNAVKTAAGTTFNNQQTNKRTTIHDTYTQFNCIDRSLGLSFSNAHRRTLNDLTQFRSRAYLIGFHLPFGSLTIIIIMIVAVIKNYKCYFTLQQQQNDTNNNDYYIVNGLHCKG